MSSLKLSRVQYEWSVFSWILLLIGLTSFLLGTYVAFVQNSNHILYPVSEIKKHLHKIGYDEKLFFRITIILFFVYLLSFILNVVLTGFIPLFHHKPAWARTHFGVFGLGMLVQLAPTVLFFIVCYFSLISKNHRRKIVLIFIALIVFLTYFTLLQRFNLFLWIAISLAFLYYSTHFIRPRNLFLLLIFLVFIGYSVTLIRLGQLTVAFTYYFSAMKFSIKYAIFSEPYMYLAINPENFANAVSKIDSHTFGYYTFNAFFSISGLKHPVAEYFNLLDYPHLLSIHYNTYTMFWDYYRDFGVIGLFIIPFFTAYFIGFLYYKMRKMPSIFTISMYGIGVFIIIFSFFNNMLGLLHFVFNLIVIGSISKYLLKKGCHSGKKW